MTLTNDMCSSHNCKMFGNVLPEILNYMRRNETPIEDHTNDDVSLVCTDRVLIITIVNC